MPIYHKTPPSIVGGNHNTAEIDYHTSEAAKVKRTREQAYFNSYDFDAIEVLPYDEDDEDDVVMRDGGGRGRRERGGEVGVTQNITKMNSQQTKHLSQRPNLRQQHKPAAAILTKQHLAPQQHLHQQQLHSNHSSFSGGSSSSDSFMVDNHHHQQQQQQLQHHSRHQQYVSGNTNKYNPTMYLQRFSEIFVNKNTNNSNNNKKKLQQQHHYHQHHHQQHHQQHLNTSLTSPSSGTASAAINIGNDNKHLKMSSSETSSTSLSSASAVEEVLNGYSGGGGGAAVGNTPTPTTTVAAGSATSGHRDVILESVVAVVGSINNTSISSCTTTDKNVNTNKGGSQGGNFLLPRAMLKYQSTSVLVATTTAAAPTTTASNITPATTNSMPLAIITTAATTSNTNTSSHQQQSTRDVNKTDGVGNGNGKNIMLPPVNTSGGNGAELRLKKTSTTSSITTSLASEELAIIEQGENVDVSQNLDKTKVLVQQQRKVLPKNITNPKSTTTARASSHQSHYSTDKSASSGYYSSNVCSTYSLEEHIYSEPSIDIKDIRNPHNQKESSKNIAPRPQPPPPPASKTTKTTTLPPTSSSMSTANTLQISSLKQAATTNSKETANSVMRSLDYSRRYRLTEENDTRSNNLSNHLPTLPPSSPRNSQEFNENLKILESSIENLDRHLKTFPSAVNQDAIVGFVQNPYSSYASINHHHQHPHQNDKSRSTHLPTIQESFDVVNKKKKQSWSEDHSDDSLQDIDLDSFLLDKDKQIAANTNNNSQSLVSKGIDNPSFLTEEQEENHYKCAKYINSCPEDAYRVESDIHAPTRSSISEQSVAISVGELYPKRYEEQIHFQNTRELLEDVRDKIRQLTQSQDALAEIPNLNVANLDAAEQEAIPKELNSMITTLKQELELYLERMNQHSELEIRQLCTGLVKNQNIVKMKNAFERRKSLTDCTTDICSAYEAIQDSGCGMLMNGVKGVPITIRQQITSIRCTSDPNFKMKRKSLTEVFPMAECYIESIKTDATGNHPHLHHHHPANSQLHRNLNYHKPVLEQLNTQLCAKPETSSTSASGGDTSETNDKESILDWHRKKPSIWEMYYGTNRIQQSLLGSKKNGTMMITTSASSPSTMCYPSSRPESDFTLDLPRAEQLRIKMEKEKKFRHRCRVITTFLSLVFFLLTVMVVSLVLTRGKRMFGSMI